MSTPRHDRLVELLADRALVGLEPMEQIELAELMLEFPGEDPLGYDRAAAAVALAMVELEAMPAGLAERLEKEASFQANTEHYAPPPARHHAATVAMPGAPSRPQPQPAPPMHAQMPMQQPSMAPSPQMQQPSPSMQPPSHPSNVVPFPARPVATTKPQASAGARVFAIGGWVAAAACLVLAIGAFVYGRKPVGPVSVNPSSTVPTAPIPTTPVSVASVTPPSPKEETAAALRERLLALKTTAKMDWTATKDPAAKGATGEVLWNAEEQKGTMRFRGLAKNDATRAQYQLWIFDKSRDEKYPVDGGVFDIDAESGDVVVAIKARLPVDKATLFAVTVEKPGGVVVSKRERIVVVAKPAT